MRASTGVTGAHLFWILPSKPPGIVEINWHKQSPESLSQKARASINGAHASQAEGSANGHSINFGRCIHYAFDLGGLPNLDDITRVWLSFSKVEGT